MNPSEANISYILTYLEHKPPSALIRTFVDDWFGYHRGCPFLNKNKKTHWLNQRDLIKKLKAVLEMHINSDAAHEVWYERNNQDLIKDHAILVKVLTDLPNQTEDPTMEKVKVCLCSYNRLGILTQSKNEVLTKSGLKYRIPDYCDGSEVWARYKAVGISGGSPTC